MNIMFLKGFVAGLTVGLLFMYWLVHRLQSWAGKYYAQKLKDMNEGNLE